MKNTKAAGEALNSLNRFKDEVELGKKVLQAMAKYSVNYPLDQTIVGADFYGIEPDKNNGPERFGTNIIRNAVDDYIKKTWDQFCDFYNAETNKIIARMSKEAKKEMLKALGVDDEEEANSN